MFVFSFAIFAFAAVSANVFANAFVIVALAVASGAMNLPYLDSC